MSPKLRIFLGVFLLTLAFDFASKRVVSSQLTYADRIEVIEGFFYLTHVRNPGAAFSFLAESPAAIRQPFFVGVTLIAIIVILSFYRRLAPGDHLSALALGAILGGAVGNLIDRIWHGEVIDFLHFVLWGGYHWPDFNLADSFIVCGVALLILELIAAEGESRSNPAQADS